MASPGTYISGVGHVGLVVWLIAGWGFQSDPLPFEVTEVSVVSGDEYAALVAASAPDQDEDAPDAPEAPVAPIAEDVPEPLTAEEDVAEVEPPAPVEPPAAETPPPEAPEPPAPVADVTDTAPAEPLPPVEPTPEILAPITEEPPQQEEAPRIAPEPVEAPAPETQIADVVQEATEPDVPAEDIVPDEPVEEAAPEEAATEIVTEAETPSGAVEVSMRPQVRPNRPTPVEEPADEPAEPTTAEALAESDADVEAAVAAALAAVGPISDVLEGPPLTGSESEGFRVAVNDCWNVDPGSVASRVIVEVGFSLDQSGRVTGEVRLVGSDGDGSATQTAYQAARRAILRCQGQNGYDLPIEKYSHWKDVIITFDPSGMRLR